MVTWFVEQNANEERNAIALRRGQALAMGGESDNRFFFIAQHSIYHHPAVRMDPRSCRQGPTPTVPAKNTKRCQYFDKEDTVIKRRVGDWIGIWIGEGEGNRREN